MGRAAVRKRQRTDWDDDKFISRCREAAARKGWSIEDLSEAAGFDRYFLSKPAAVGRRIDGVISLAHAAGVSLDWLAGIDPEPIGIDPVELARLGAVANVAAHLYVAISVQHSDMDANAIIRSVLEVIGHKADKPAIVDEAIAAGRQEGAAEPKSAARAERTRHPRTN